MVIDNDTCFGTHHLKQISPSHSLFLHFLSCCRKSLLTNLKPSIDIASTLKTSKMNKIVKIGKEGAHIACTVYTFKYKNKLHSGVLLNADKRRKNAGRYKIIFF